MYWNEEISRSYDVLFMIKISLFFPLKYNISWILWEQKIEAIFYKEKEYLIVISSLHVNIFLLFILFF